MLSYALTNATTFLYHAQSKCLSCIFLSILKSNLSVIPNKNSVATTARLFVCLPHCWEVLIGLNLSSALPIWRLHVLRHSHAFQKHSRYKLRDSLCVLFVCNVPCDWLAPSRGCTRPFTQRQLGRFKLTWHDSKKKKKGCILIFLVLFGIRYFKLYCKKNLISIWSVETFHYNIKTKNDNMRVTCYIRY